MDQLRGGICDHPGLYQVPLHLHLCLLNLITATSVPLCLSEQATVLTRKIYIWGPCSTGNLGGIHKQCMSAALVPCGIFVVCSLVTKSCPVLCDPMDCSMPGFPILHYLMEIVQTHVHWVVMSYNHLTLFCSFFLLPSIFPSIRVFSNESAFPLGGHMIGAPTSALVLPMTTQDWFLLGLTGLIFQSKGLSRVFSSTTVWKH